MDKDIVVIGSGPRAIGVVGALGLTGRSIDGSTQIFADECTDFDGDSMVLPRGNPTDLPGSSRRHTGVAKDRRVARKKRARKLARRR